MTGGVVDVPHQAQILFVTGTDTGVGKTLIASALLIHFRSNGNVSACGFKPVASGASLGEEGLRNDDALTLQAASWPRPEYQAINPYCFEPPIAPHLAARQADMPVRSEVMDAALARLSEHYDRIVIEGAGGWLVPLNETQTFADWVSAHQWPVILVVGIRLGCINHALLTVESIGRSTRLHGWIANCLPPAPPNMDDIIEALKQRIAAPLLAIVPPGASPDVIAAQLRSEALAG